MAALMTSCPSTTQTGWAHFINAASAALRSLAVAAGIAGAGAMLPALAHADAPNDSITTALNGAGIGNNGSLNTAIAGLGRSICPSLVKPGATLASIASKVSGNTGLSPSMAGLAASMAIQMECPGLMASLANGNVPSPLQGAGAHAFPSIPFQSPGASPVAPNPLALPGH